MATLGCLGPKLFSLISRASSYRGTAFSSFPYHTQTDSQLKKGLRIINNIKKTNAHKDKHCRMNACINATWLLRVLQSKWDVTLSCGFSPCVCKAWPSVWGYRRERDDLGRVLVYGCQVLFRTVPRHSHTLSFRCEARLGCSETGRSRDDLGPAHAGASPGNGSRTFLQHYE